MDHLLDKITPVEKGSRIFDILTSDRVNAWQEIMRCLVSGENIIQTPFLHVTQSANGVELSPTVRSGSGGGGGKPCVHLKSRMINTSATGTPSYVVRVSDGLVFNETPKIGSTPLNAVTPPGLPVSLGDSLYLVFDWSPSSRQISAAGTTIHLLAGGGYPKNIRYEVHSENKVGVAPQINRDNGTPTDGKAYVKWGSVLDAGNGEVKFTDYRCGNCFVTFCPPKTYGVYFEENTGTPL